MDGSRLSKKSTFFETGIGAFLAPFLFIEAGMPVSLVLDGFWSLMVKILATIGLMQVLSRSYQWAMSKLPKHG